MAKTFPFQVRDDNPSGPTPGPLATSSTYKVLTIGYTVYVATASGLSISADGGKVNSFQTPPQLQGHEIQALYVLKGEIYVGTKTDGIFIGTYDVRTNTFTQKYHWTTATTPAIGDNDVHDIFVNEVKGNTYVYVSTAKGLSISTDGGSSFKTHRHTDNDPHITADDDYAVAAVYDSATDKNYVYLATRKITSGYDQGFDVIVMDNLGNFESVTQKTTADNLGSDVVFSLYAYKKRLYIGTSAGLNISENYGATLSKPITVADGLADNNVKSVYAVHPKFCTFAAPTPRSYCTGGIVYAGTEGGLSISTDDGKTFSVTETTTNGLSQDRVDSVFARGNGSTIYTAGPPTGNLSLGTYRPFINRTEAYGNLNSNTVHSVYAKGKDVYAGTGKGLNVSNDYGDTFNYIDDGFAYSPVLGIASDDTKVYIATENGLAIGTINPDGTLGGFTPYLSGKWINGVYVKADPSGSGTTDVYAATDHGLQEMIEGATTFQQKLADSVVKGVFASGATATVYAATEDGLYKSIDNGKNFSLTNLEDYVENVYVEGNTIYHDGIVAATKKGLQYSINGGYTWYNESEFGNEKMYSVFLHKMYSVFLHDGIVYAGSKGAGISINTDYDQSYWVTGTVADGLGKDTIYGIYVNDNTVYVATGKGLAIGAS